MFLINYIFDREAAAAHTLLSRLLKFDWQCK